MTAPVDWHERLLGRGPHERDTAGRVVIEPVSDAKGLAHTDDRGDLVMANAAPYIRAMETKLLRALVRSVTKVADGRKLDVVELGGGTGHFFDHLRPVARTYVNVEPSPVPLDEAGAARHSDSRFLGVRCRAERAPFPDASFDLALMLASLDHMPDHAAALAECARCLRKGGHVLVVLNNRRSWWKVLLARTEYLRTRERRIARHHYFQWSIPEAVAALSVCFRIESVRTMTFLPYVPMLWPLLLPVADALVARLLPMRGANMILIARKR